MTDQIDQNFISNIFMTLQLLQLFGEQNFILYAKAVMRELPVAFF